ncbi:WD40-repeat-containing domain [Pseudocohnilembus persalinus]|uniref:WD40-repeat-containing domain n=1 Tax=Pseudocohnilembus persalinus TaxID=266149 RepID=A0A0V0Q898_PSEPJ|nr:WD40-repeat-containing domain [Pseudocohnilembus persalinus]|eukprot:KRW98383.1 WD40-repeat-containing domain [Pseudocohnilembus persalinus]
MLDFIQYSLIPQKFTITDIAQFIQKKSIFPDHSQQYINDNELICQDIINFQIDNQGYKQNDPLENLFQIQTYIENIQCSFTDNPYQKLNTTFQVPEKTNYQTYLNSSPYKILENKTQIKMLQTLPASQYQNNPGSSSKNRRKIRKVKGKLIDTKRPRTDSSAIQIPFASLQEGIFCNTNFSNSILQGVDFSNSLLRETNFSNCDLKDIILGKHLDLNGHLKPINCLAQTSINAQNYGQIQLLASGSQDKTIIIWNPHTNTQFQKIKTSSYCKSLLFIKQGLYLIAGFQSGDLIFYRLQISRQNIQIQENNQEQKLLNQKIDSYQIKYLKIFKEVQAHEDTVSSIQYSDLNSFLITCSHDVSVKIWNLQEPKYTNQQQQQSGQNLIKYSSQKVNLRDYANIQPQISIIQLYQILRNHENYINQICFKQPYLASCSDDQQVIIYRLNEINIQSSQQKNIIFQLEQRMKNFKSGVLCIDISKDLKFLAAGTRDQCIYIKYILNGQNFFVKKQKDQIDNILDGIQSVKFIFDSQYIITGNSSSFIQIWNCNQQTLNQQIEGHTKGITSIQVSENNQFFFSASRDSSIKIFNSNENINQLSGQQERPRDLNSNKEQATQIKFLFDSKFLIQVFNDSKLRIYSLETSDFVKSVDTQQYCIKQIDLSQDEALLASIGIKNQYIKIYETSTFDQLKSFQGHTSQINQVSFSPDSKVVASCSNDGTVRIWNIKQSAHQNFGNSTPQLQIKKMLPQHQYKFKAQKHILLDDHNKKQVNFVKFSTQGSQQYLASSGFDNTINLYSVLDNYQKFTLIRKLKLHKDWVTSLQFSPIDEKTLISGDLLGNLYQWNINVNEISKIQCEVIQQQNQENANQITYIEFSACGNYFFYITNKSEIRIRTINQKNANNKTGTQFLGGQQFPLCLTVSKDKRFLAVGSYLDSIKEDVQTIQN